MRNRNWRGPIGFFWPGGGDPWKFPRTKSYGRGSLWPRDLRGKSAVVTGSTSGIGLGIAQALAAQGANVLLNGFGEASQIEETRRSLADTHGIKAIYNGADAASAVAIKSMIAQATRELGGVDILVNNAGIQHTAPIPEFPTERWDAIIAINLSAAFHATAAVIPQMKERGWGESSISRRPMVLSGRRTNRPMSRPNMG